MNISRRGFIQALVTAAAAAAATGVNASDFDPERLLWTPGAKTIFLPPAPKVASLVTDASEVQAAFNTIQSSHVDTVLRDAKRRGAIDFDANWNLVGGTSDIALDRIILAEWRIR